MSGFRFIFQSFQRSKAQKGRRSSEIGGGKGSRLPSSSVRRAATAAGIHSRHLLFAQNRAEKNPRAAACNGRTGGTVTSCRAVQALASQGGEVALCDTLSFDIACSDQRVMSPSLCGSDPYPCGSLTYRTD